MNKTRAWHFWDWKSIRRIVLVFSILLVLLAFFFLYPDWKRDSNAQNCTERSTAVLIDIRPNEEMSMSKTGNKTVTHSYSLTYKYAVKKVQYQSTDVIPNSLENKPLLSKIIGKQGTRLKILYDPENPQKSIVVE